MKKTRGIHELYAENPERADQLVWGRQADPVIRRGFLKKSGLLAMTTALGVSSIPFADNLPMGLIPAALADPVCGAWDLGHTQHRASNRSRNWAYYR